MKQLQFIGILILVLTSCKSLKISEHPFADVPFPKDFRDRLFLQNSDQIRDDISDVLGRLITIDPNGNTGKIESRRLVSDGANPKVTAIENGIVYESKNKLSTSTELSFILPDEFSTNTSVNTMVETIVEDIVVARITDDMIDWERIINLVKQLEAESSNKKYCVITQARLTNLMLKTFREIDSQNKVAVGDVFKANGKIYNSNSERVMDYTVSCQCLDIISLVKTSVSNQAAGMSEEEKLQNLIRTIRSSMDEQGDLLHSSFSWTSFKGKISLKF